MTGDTVRVHNLIKEGNKQRVQVFEGVIIRRHRLNELTACITVRRIASGVGVEKTFLLHSPNVVKVEILRRAKVRRNFLSFLRNRRGKSARLKEIAFDKVAANNVAGPVLDAEVTEVDVDASQDALDQAEPLEAETHAEAKAAAAEDEVNAAVDTDVTNEQTAAADEFDAGVEKAETAKK
jgi:large subunit ribosomal protein L19